MNARELLTDWPGEQLTSAEGIFQSPAWRLPIVYEGAPSVLTQGTTRPLDLLALSLTFDGEPSVIGLADSPNFPDLHILWRRRNELPREVLLALIEKECGPLFQMLEDATKCLVAVKGLEWDEVGETDVPFALTRPDGLTLAFTWAVPPRVLARLGVLDNLDLTHAAIRALTRPAWAVYASLTLTSSEAFKRGNTNHVQYRPICVDCRSNRHVSVAVCGDDCYQLFEDRGCDVPDPQCAWCAVHSAEYGHQCAGDDPDVLHPGADGGEELGPAQQGVEG